MVVALAWQSLLVFVCTYLHMRWHVCMHVCMYVFISMVPCMYMYILHSGAVRTRICTTVHTLAYIHPYIHTPFVHCIYMANRQIVGRQPPVLPKDEVESSQVGELAKHSLGRNASPL